MKFIYMKITEDEYQLPELIADSARELAEKCNVPLITIRQSLLRLRKGTTRKVKYIKVEIDDE